MTKEEIHSELGKPETTFMRNSYDNTGETEEYKDLFVSYDEEGKCEAIEFFELADIYNGKAYGYEQELTFENEIDQTHLKSFAKRLFTDHEKYMER